MRAICKKVRFFFTLTIAFFRRQQKMLFLGFLLGISSFLLIPRIYKKLTFQKAERIGYIGKFTYDTLPLEIQKKISKGLTDISSDGRVIPQIAKSWEINKNGKEYIFSLGDDFFWQDGKPLKAQDISYGFSDVATTFLGEKKIKFELKEPFSPFPFVVSQPLFKRELIGLGEYKVTKIKRSGQIIHQIHLLHQKEQKRVILKFYPTEEALKIAFKLGEIDIIKEISYPDEFNSWDRVRIIPEVKYNRLVAVFFNTNNPKFSEKSFRQALAYAIEKKWPYRALGPINPHSWAYNPNVKPYNFDLENAKKLFEKVEGKNQEIKKIELSTVPALLETAEGIKSNWEKLGISCKIKITNSLDEPFEALLAIQEIPSDPDQYSFWHSTQKLNITKYENPKIDKLLEEGRGSFDDAKRKEIYSDFQKSLVEETPAIFLFHPIVYTILKI